jgi:hypothetical protein
LPTVAAVQAAIHGTNAHDTAIRVSGALEVLQYFITVLSGNPDPGPGYNSSTWPEAAKRRQEYQAASFLVRKKMISGEPPAPPGRNPEFYARIESEHLSEDRKFAAEVLPKFVSKASQDAFFAAAVNWYERHDAIGAAVAAKRGNGSALDVDCANARVSDAYGHRTEEAKQLRARCEAGRQGEAARAHSERFVAGDLAKARSAGVNLSVFGVPLGEPVTIPDCPKVDMFTMSTAQVNEARATKATMDACRVDANDGPLNWASTMILDPEGAGYSEISLAASKRPPWVNYTGMLIKGGLVIAVTIATTDENQKDQITALRSKYGKPQPQSVEGTLEWRLPGLYVQFQDRSSIPQPTQYVGGNAIGNAALNYGSIMGHEKKPNLFIMLESVHKNQVERKAAKKAAEPKL